MIDLTSLPTPKAINSSYADILNQLKETFQNITGRPLYPSDDETFLLEIIAYQRIILEYAINQESLQNLLYFAQDERLDHIAAPANIQRLPAQPAITTLRLTFSEHPASIVIPENWQVIKDDIIFHTTQAYSIDTDQNTIDIPVTCSQSGTIGNGFIAGEINTPVKPLNYLDSIQNIIVSAGGADIESDEHFRKRIQLYPESLSVAGPEMAYEFLTKSTHQDIIDVSISTPQYTITEFVNRVITLYNQSQSTNDIANAVKSMLPGTVNIAPLLKGGTMPTQTLLDDIQSKLSATNVCPLCDIVNVMAPESIIFDVELTIYTTTSIQHETIENIANERLNNIAEKWRESLGQDIIPEVLLAECQDIGGVYRVTVESPVFQTLENHQFPVMNNIVIHLTLV